MTSMETKYSRHAKGCVEMINNALNNSPQFWINQNWGEFMPKISKKDFGIRYSYRFEIASLLFLSGNFEAVLDYWFALHSLFNGCYSGTLCFLQQLKCRISSLPMKFKLYRAANDGLLDYMSLFVILHEIAHGVYISYPDLKRDAFSEIDKELQTLINSFRECDIIKSPLIHDLHNKKRELEKLGLDSEKIMTIENLISLSQNEIVDLDKVMLKEELACDLYSLSISVQVVNYRTKSKNEYLSFYKGSILALILISRYNYIAKRYVKLQDDKRYAMNHDAELVRLQFYNNECIQGLKSRRIDTTSYYNVIKRATIAWLSKVNNYVDKYYQFILEAANGINKQDTSEKQAISCLERLENIIMKKYLL